MKTALENIFPRKNWFCLVWWLVCERALSHKIKEGAANLSLELFNIHRRQRVFTVSHTYVETISLTANYKGEGEFFLAHRLCFSSKGLFCFMVPDSRYGIQVQNVKSVIAISPRWLFAQIGILLSSLVFLYNPSLVADVHILGNILKITRRAPHLHLVPRAPRQGLELRHNYPHFLFFFLI